MKKDPKTEQIKTRIDPELKEAFKKKAEKEGHTVSSKLMYLVKRYLAGAIK